MREEIATFLLFLCSRVKATKSHLGSDQSRQEETDSYNIGNIYEITKEKELSNLSKSQKRQFPQFNYTSHLS